MAENFGGVISHVTVGKMLTYAMNVSLPNFLELSPPLAIAAVRPRHRVPLPLGTEFSLADEVGWIQFFLHVLLTCFVNKCHRPFPGLHGTKPRRYGFPTT
mmetsp:Transcript_1808/g.1584  ORF Transcript_1808/g.1584 Transcript_1808/m.1584 type:complete len:100 (+) Transcript_1808:248-547(+)